MLAWLAKASFSSYTSTSSFCRPALASAFGMAREGAVPITPGGTPTAAKERSVAKTGRPRRAASSRRMSSTAAAQSVFCCRGSSSGR